MLELYIIACLTTAIVHHFDIWSSAFEELMEKQPDNLIVKHRVSSTITVFFLTFLLTPVIVVILLSPSRNKKFREALVNSMMD